MSNKKQTILITGCTGGLSRQLVVRLRRKYEVIGVDSRTPTRKLVGIDKFYRIHYTKSGFENIFRTHKISKIIHLGRISHTGLQKGAKLFERFNQNVVGSAKVLDLGLKYGVKHVIVLSTFHVYGSLPDNPIYIDEQWPLRASLSFPEIRDVVELDYNSRIWMWKNQKSVKTLILRPTNIIGPIMQNAITTYLRGPLTPTLMGFNPMFQAIHEKDMSSILVECLEKEITGTYNVAPDETMPLTKAIEYAGSQSLPLPYTLILGITKTARALWRGIPPHLINYLKYPCVIDGKNLINELDHFKFRYTMKDALTSIRLESKGPQNFKS